ncbi:MarR family winged helix-turn-helix transcriptional regulator [uncultured Clostridium sp.]|uniref:MarR family winged helix-turn-helix transcriptional regulator n=1 Tax=uncultured Clostridium sp. TaxID=59620 RepID=UPI0025DDE56C|nr:MarR family winged helix-turn-helix transcriptional regulator [uncultured Clostridium sp.]
MNSDLKFSRLFGAIHNVFKKVSDKSLKEINLTSPQMNILFFISSNKNIEINQKDIEKHFYLKSSTVTDIISRLEHNGFLYRTTSEKDKRYKKIVLTEKGENIHERMLEMALNFETCFTKGMTKGESEILFELLQKVLKNVSQE